MPFLHSLDWCTSNLLLQHLLAVALTLVCPHSNCDSTMCFCPGNPHGRIPEAGNGLGKKGRGRGWWPLLMEREFIDITIVAFAKVSYFFQLCYFIFP